MRSCAGGCADDESEGNSKGEGPWEDGVLVVRESRDGKVMGEGKVGRGELES